MCGAATAQTTLPQTNTFSEQDRLIATGRLWGTVKYFHPYLAYRKIDWDKALVDALPKIRAASNPADYAKALGVMLDALQDPVTIARIGPVDAVRDFVSSSSSQRTWIHFGLGLDESAFVARAGLPQVQTLKLPMGEGVEAVVRLSEPVPADATALVPPPGVEVGDPEMRYPAMGYRILAAYKIWTVFHYFFAYRDLMDEDWDDVFASFLPKFMAAKDAREYNLTIAEMVTHVSDSQARVESEELWNYFGEAPVGLRMRLIEKKPVVTEVLDEAAKKAGVQRGDMVTSVDGENVIERINREAKYISWSTQQSLADRVMAVILNGPEGSRAALTIRGENEQTKQVTLNRSEHYVEALSKQRNGEAVRVLPGNIGYVDLNRCSGPEIDEIFERLRETKAIVFDGRGSVMGLGTKLPAHLATHSDVAAAIVTGPLVLAPDVISNGRLTSTASSFRVEALPAPENSIYKGKTVMLIDERTHGEAELTGLTLEAANNTAFVGSASAGAAGMMGDFIVPGPIHITFSSTDIRHGNGGKLQRLGLQPAELVTPTVAGVRAGRDEVLERAIEYVSH
jgi:C-terminal processing protease CtpA/Prc